MPEQTPEELPLPLQLALNYAPTPQRPAAEAVFRLDARLARFVLTAQELSIAQIRLAWWRDSLLKSTDDRPQGDQVLDAIGREWAGETPVLAALVDGWEALLFRTEGDESGATEFETAWAAAFGALARLASAPAHQDGAANAGRRWGRAVWFSFEGEGSVHENSGRARLPRSLRHLAVLNGIGRRALQRGGGPLIAGRGDMLAIARLGLIGR
ncbi:hypothetical protein [Qipengyuania sp. JC766]|uniref:hypothetical protein n=1 Tax=Qipengyuania sp. JC766 TaxID=3232139 RepID=UPI003458328C